MLSTQETIEERDTPRDLESVFDDFEARSNIVELFDLLLKIDKRLNPDNYKLPLRNQYD